MSTTVTREQLPVPVARQEVVDRKVMKSEVIQQELEHLEQRKVMRYEVIQQGTGEPEAMRSHEN